MPVRDKYTLQDIIEIIQTGRLDRGRIVNFINNDDAVFISNSDITESVYLTESFIETTKRTIIFSNCTFYGEVHIRRQNLINSYHFVECIFEKSASFQLRTTISLSNNCHFKKELTIAGDGDTLCNVSDITVDATFAVTGVFSNELSLQKINFYDSEKKGNLIITQAMVSAFSVTKSNLKNIIIENTVKANGDILLWHINVVELIVQIAELSGELRLSSSNILIFREGYLKKRCYLALVGNTIGEAAFDLSDLSGVDISGGTFNYLRLYGTNDKDSAFNIVDSKIYSLEFHSIKNEGKLTLTGIDIPPNGRLLLESSNLGKADFFNCKFSDAVLEFENSKITEIFLVETDFPENVKLEGKFNHAQAQLAFGQLHTTLQKQGDTVRSLEYQAREIEAHYKILKQKSYILLSIGRLFNRNKLPNKLSNVKSANNLVSNCFLLKNRIWREAITVANIFSLWLNSLSNNFGRSWQRGVVFSFGIGALFFYFLVLGSNEYSFGFSIDLNSALIRSYLKFMNPIRFFELENLFKDKNNSNSTYLTLDSTWCFVWDFLGRVFVAYGYYQTIQAFRRFGRK